MLTVPELYSVARSRYDEAKILHTSQKPAGAVYLCGYAVELILKRHIVKILDWDAYPETTNQFKEYRSFKTHDLNVLIRLAGLENKIQADTTMYARWQIVKRWNSEMRYKSITSVTDLEAQDIINATKEVVNFILAQ